MEKFWKYKLDHILFWAITVGFHIYTRTRLIESSGWENFAGEIILRNGLLAILIYFHLNFLLRQLTQAGKVTLYIFGLLTGLAFYVFIKSLHDGYLETVGDQPSLSFVEHSFYNASIALFYLAFSLALHLSKEWFFQREKVRKLEVENLNAELQYLKLQINPHFLFNSLNTIYFQIDKSNGPARDTLLKFADLLRYPLYECNGKEVPLEKEINYLKNFIGLQRLRQDERYKIEFDCDVADLHKSIAPLLLIPFVENAFKHISHHDDSSNEVRIVIQQEAGKLIMRVFNTKEKMRPAVLDGGIGLKNVIRRLDLLYGSDYTLDIQDREKSYEVLLSVPLHET